MFDSAVLEVNIVQRAMAESQVQLMEGAKQRYEGQREDARQSSSEEFHATEAIIQSKIQELTAGLADCRAAHLFLTEQRQQVGSCVENIQDAAISSCSSGAGYLSC